MTSPALPTSGTLERVKAILRRDLRLGADAAVADDMPLVGGELDLDSLDVLLLLTSIEKEFGIKIPSEAVGNAIFANVGTLARYLDQDAGANGAGGGAAGGGAGADPLARLPHGEPFRFVSRLVTLKEGESGEGIWAVSGQEAFFAGHFPGRPIVPGVLLAEALAQMSGLVGPGSHEGQVFTDGRLAQVDVRFDAAVVPPAEVRLQVKLARAMGALQQFEVVALVGQTVAARGTLTLNRAPADGGGVAAGGGNSAGNA